MASSEHFQVPPTAIVVTDKCFIRPYEVSDAAALAAAANHEDVSKYMRNLFPFPYSLDDAQFFINLASERQPMVNYAIVLLDGTYVGGIGLKPMADVESGTFEIGYWVGKDHWGKGITTSAAKAFSKWAFENFPDLRRLEAGIFEGNVASMKILERAGYTKEGVRRKAVFKRGVSLDITIYGLLREEAQAW
ncbi:acyl-CoA N-acyltransferase [Xylariales sp. PMI_506]|nr:acyl-CoA N-acyltransferase [Xylariales sp. PMI_506]